MVLWHNECSRVMMSAHGPMVPCPWLFLSSHECSLLHGPSSWVFMASPIRFSWAIMGTHEHSLAFMGTNKQPRAAMSVPYCQWALMSVHEHSWAWGHGAINTHESSKAVMSMVPWGHGHSSLLMSTHYALAPYLWMLMSAHEHTWVLMRAHECSWVLNCFIEQQNFNF
jgi:hypothetical protein